jgi:hypothetical protein
MKNRVYPRLLLACCLLGAAACSKKSDPAPAQQVSPTPTGTYTDASGTAYPLTNLRAVVASVTFLNGSSGQRFNVYGTLADGQVVTTGYPVSQAAMPATPGALPAGPATEAYYIKVAATTDTAPAYGVSGYSTGALAAESATVISGQYDGPLRPAPGVPASTTLPKVHVVFAHVALQP